MPSVGSITVVYLLENCCKAPTLIITGDSDLVIPAANSNILNDKISGSELKIIKEGGHGFGYTHAAEIAKIMTDFLS